MKTTVKAGLIFSLIWIISVLIAFLLGYSVNFFLISELLSLLLLVGAIFSGLFFTKKEKNYEKSNALEDFKVALQAGMVYTIMITAFVYVYHKHIDPALTQSFIDQRIEALHTQYPDEASFKKLQEQDMKWETFSRDDFIENQEDQISNFIGSFFTTLVHLMALFIFSLFYSFFVMLVIRKVILRN